MTGHLHLVCAADASGRSFLREQSFRAPMHISKPFHDAGALVVNVVNPTAGFFSGDEVACSVRVENGARLLLTSPSASRVHRMENADGLASLWQEFSVTRGAFLEVLPEIFIPQNGSRFLQRTRICVEPGGALIFFETLAPGRVASGEAFAFAQLDWETDVFFGDEKIARERYKISPDENESLHALREKFSCGYYASCFAIGEPFVAINATKNAADYFQKIDALHENERAWIGSSRLAAGGCVVKMIARDSLALREKMRALRGIFYEALGRSAPQLRRF